MSETREMNDLDAIGMLRQRIEGFVDADMLLLEDGQGLLAALDGALAGLTGANEAATLAGIAAFVGRLRALIEAGDLAAEDGQPPLEAAAAIAAVLPKAGRTEAEPGSRPGKAAMSRENLIPVGRGPCAARPGTERNEER
jgi:hypothetical protein